MGKSSLRSQKTHFSGRQVLNFKQRRENVKFYGGAKKPFKPANQTKYPQTLLYDDGSFLIASGDDEENRSVEKLNIGIRWLKGRKEAANGTPNSSSAGYPPHCWLMLPDDFALCLLTCAKNKQACLNKDEVDRALQILSEQISKEMK